MTLANIGPTVSEPDGCEVWLWHEFGLFVADSAGILADALTPQAVALLTLVDTDRLGSPPPLPASVRGWTPLPVPPPATRAKQRSPPEQGGERGRGKFLKQEVQVDAVRPNAPGATSESSLRATICRGAYWRHRTLPGRSPVWRKRAWEGGSR